MNASIHPNRCTVSSSRGSAWATFHESAPPDEGPTVTVFLHGSSLAGDGPATLRGLVRGLYERAPHLYVVIRDAARECERDALGFRPEEHEEAQS